MSPDQPSTPEASDQMARRCPVCETVFTVASSTSRQVFCSPTCRETNRQKMPTQLICAVCSNEFTANGRPRRIYCSTQCKTKALNSSDYLEQRTCPTCENNFDVPKTVRRIYCSPVCRRDAERQREQERDEARARRLGETPPPLPELPPPPKPSHRRGASRQLTAERDPLEPTATRNCPHCQQPVAIVALLATPEAARPAMAFRGPDIVPLRRTP
ncbi:hypothetical protein ABZ307_39775 [Streptomyces griseorubiginosus]|uniref:hypothetical protein n=1 Tax=Streptomyces griseorubiginosus TaxID=67304 RepID=UPI0033B56D76